MIDALERVLAPLKRRVQLSVRRGLLKLLDDGEGLQSIQVELLAGETQGKVRRFQNYGFNGLPIAGAETILLSIGAQGEQLVALVIDDKRYRPTGGLPGEVMMYSLFGQSIVLKADGSVEIKAAPAAAVTGLVTGACACAFTGAPHPQASLSAKAGL